MVVVPAHKEAHQTSGDVRNEWVIMVEGVVNRRPERMIKEDEPNGDVEVEVLELSVINQAITPPFEVNQDTSKVNEETRLTYRYVDLRTERMQYNLRKRGEVTKFIRDYLYDHKFVEISTPILTKRRRKEPGILLFRQECILDVLCFTAVASAV
jgi:aspartyl-tRNA synthetase